MAILVKEYAEKKHVYQMSLNIDLTILENILKKAGDEIHPALWRDILQSTLKRSFDSFEKLYNDIYNAYYYGKGDVFRDEEEREEESKQIKSKDKDDDVEVEEFC